MYKNHEGEIKYAAILMPVVPNNPKCVEIKSDTPFNLKCRVHVEENGRKFTSKLDTLYQIIEEYVSPRPELT